MAATSEVSLLDVKAVSARTGLARVTVYKRMKVRRLPAAGVSGTEGAAVAFR